MNWIDRAIAALSPSAGLRRVRARAAMSAVMRYDAASRGRRTHSLTPNGLDADAAGAARERLAHVARDMTRNTPLALRAVQAITNNSVGDGIIPSVEASPGVKARGEELLRQHFDTTAIDADGRNNLYGLQRVVMACVVESGEALIRRRMRRTGDGLPVPFQVQVMEPDFIDSTKDGDTAGGYIRQGIEYDAIGRRVAYWLYDEHPGRTGGLFSRRGGYQSRRVPASEILHIYRVDRPGQQRGVSWLAPVALALQDLHDGQDAELVRKKIAACFAAFRYAQDDASDAQLEATVGATLQPGAIQTLGPGEDIKFAAPPAADGFEEFNRVVLRAIAAGLGITYEALTGDLGNVNYSSARMGRMEMDRNISSWQWLMLVPQMLDPLAAWFMEAWALTEARGFNARVVWTPPRRVIVDPTKEFAAMKDAIRSGLITRSRAIRELGYDPAEVEAEMARDNAEADRLGLKLDSDPRADTARMTAGDAPPDDQE